MSADETLRFVLMLGAMAAVLVAVLGGGLGVARWARRTGRKPWIWVVGMYAVASIGLAIVRGILR